MLDTVFEVPVRGCRLRVSKLGSGEPIIFLHGYPENLQIWSGLAPRLAERFATIAFDWPGMGCSDPWSGGATPSDQARRLLALLDHWEIPRATLVAADMGGQPALVFAARHPDRIARLVVMNCLAFPDAETSWEIRILRRFGWNRAILRRLPATVFGRAERSFLPVGVRLPADLRADLWASFRRPDVRDFIIRLCAGYQAGLPCLPEHYARIACPTLVLWGDRDRHFPPVHAERLHAAIPGSRLDIIPGGEHWMAWHDAEGVAARISRFLP